MRTTLILLILFLCGCATKQAQLDEAIRLGNLEEVDKAISSGADLNKPVKGSYINAYPLYRSISNCDFKTTKYLISRGADPSKMIVGDDYENQHAIHRAAYVALDGCRKIVSYLVNNTNADINSKNMYEKTPLLIAVDDWTVKSSQDSERTYLMAKLLLELGADPNSRDHKDWSPLMAAAYRTKVYPNLDLLKLLLEYGADPEAATEDYPTSTYRVKLKSSIKSVKAKKDKEAASRKESLQEQKKSNDGGWFGKAFAIASVTAIASNSGISASQQVNVISATAADVINDTGGTNLNQLIDTQKGTLQTTKNTRGPTQDSTDFEAGIDQIYNQAINYINKGKNNQKPQQSKSVNSQNFTAKKEQCPSKPLGKFNPRQQGVGDDKWREGVKARHKEWRDSLSPYCKSVTPKADDLFKSGFGKGVSK